MPFEHGSKAKVYVNGYDLTEYLTSVSVSGEGETAETTTFGKVAKTYIPGLKDATLSAEGLHSPAPGEIDAVVTAALASGKSMWCYYPQDDTLGSAGYGLDALKTSYEVESPVDDVVSVSAEAQSRTGLERILSLHPLGAEAVSGSGSSLDNGVATSDGGVSYLQVTEVSGTTPSLTARVQHSADNVTWVDLLTFANVTTAGSSQRIKVTGTVNRYIRTSWTISGTSPSFTFNVAFGRY